MLKSNLKKWYPVRVYFPASSIYPTFIHEDEIKGESPEDALKNAYCNWENAERIELLDELIYNKNEKEC